MHERWSWNDVTAEHLTNGLMPEAHPEDGDDATETPYELCGDPGIAGATRTGRDDDGVGAQVAELLDRDGVVAVDLGCSAEFTELLDEVVDEAVVVVDDHHTLRHRPQGYRANSRAKFSVR